MVSIHKPCQSCLLHTHHLCQSLCKKKVDLGPRVSCFPVLFDLMMVLRSTETLSITLKNLALFGETPRFLEYPRRQPGSEGQFPTSVLTLVPARSNSQFDWLFDNKRLTNYSKELLLGFGEKLVNFGLLSRENRTKD